NSPDTLEKLRFNFTRGYKKNLKYTCDDWMKNYRSAKWLSQAHLVGIKQFRLAFIDEDEKVRQPIEMHSFAQLYKIHGHILNKNMQLLHNFLCEIKNLMADEDCPYSAYTFHIERNNVYYERHRGLNKYSFLDEEYINHVNKLYNS
ncbi:hypothetical protein KR222_005367, partial [Zaprionus bogoriensis]